MDKLASEMAAQRKHGIDKPMPFSNMKEWLPRWASTENGAFAGHVMHPAIFKLCQARMMSS